MLFFFFFKQKTAYEMRISDWSSDVCSSDLPCRSAIAQWCWSKADSPSAAPARSSRTTSMCGSPISGFDGPDPIDLLWRISRRPGAEHPGLPQDEFPHAGGLARAVMQAVPRHLWARSLLARGEHAPARAAGLSSLASWDDRSEETTSELQTLMR